MHKNFDRKIYNLSLFLQDSWFLLTHALKIRKMFRDEHITRAFVEKIMTVVTAVNGCTYCSWFHAKQALSSGLDEDQIRDLMLLQFEADADDNELTALLYAQHYAETNRQPDPALTDRLYATYGAATSDNILLAIRMIFFGNLMGNTFDAFLSRLKGKPAEKSNILFEGFFFLLTAPLMYPAKWMMKAEANQP